MPLQMLTLLQVIHLQLTQNQLKEVKQMQMLQQIMKQRKKMMRRKMEMLMEVPVPAETEDHPLYDGQIYQKSFVL